MNHEEIETALRNELGDVKKFVSYCFQQELHESIIYDVVYIDNDGREREYSVILNQH